MISEGRPIISGRVAVATVTRPDARVTCYTIRDGSRTYLAGLSVGSLDVEGAMAWLCPPTDAIEGGR